MNFKVTKTKANALLIAISALLLATLGCAAASRLPWPAPTPTQIQASLPQSEADVPRVMAEEAKAAFDSGAAIIVDVRDPQSYEESHVSGAISIPLAQIESDPASLGLHKEQWIITYCT